MCTILIVTILQLQLLYYSYYINSYRLILPNIVPYARYWRSLQNLLGSLINSIEAIVSLLVLLCLFLAIFALLGTQIFGGKFKERENAKQAFFVVRPRANFDSFAHSFYAVFQVIFSTKRNVENLRHFFSTSFEGMLVWPIQPTICGLN